jgi:two-component system cell cycle response regulator
MKILVADDEAVSRRLIERTLERYGYEVITASDGAAAARELAKPDGPRLALIDWMMPEMDGPEVCRHVRARQSSPYVYILLLTSKELSEDIVAGLEAGADDYLTKPCEPAELQARLRTGQRILKLEDNLVEAREQMRFKATHDALTSLWDRGAILTLLSNEVNRTEAGFPVSLLMCDVDHFKQINDVYGHLVGDEVLQELSSRLTNAVRQNDSVGRYGGEEFLAVLSGCPRENLAEVAEQLRQAIETAPFKTSAGDLFVSVSLGATTIEHWHPELTIEHYLKQADKALYAAKQGGRNRVVYAEPTTALPDRHAETASLSSAHLQVQTA